MRSWRGPRRSERRVCANSSTRAWMVAGERVELCFHLRVMSPRATAGPAVVEVVPPARLEPAATRLIRGCSSGWALEASWRALWDSNPKERMRSFSLATKDPGHWQKDSSWSGWLDLNHWCPCAIGGWLLSWPRTRGLLGIAGGDTRDVKIYAAWPRPHGWIHWEFNPVLLLAGQACHATTLWTHGGDAYGIRTRGLRLDKPPGTSVLP